ncbi:hypothetical protein IA829_04340 [Listeria seeligeri]|uniref:hypothetical protein n=1 Tax=Listeria seeligeri TaxID=1640 RepID=UPI001625D72D|nr:hypothetical protein [Listeria seeligeri]MBC1444554.1 hypothetical protein [Listeria seeligeri]MBC1540945.1 hypothetical protein [Listeria seeligeri]MBC1582439.1 hypothetical protein [Listeria seeligeri]MBC1772352.1 hypothetical protein [Listeria seeligeri]MBC1865563.1 hypothetical protein [Listeria seeligeri]
MRKNIKILWLDDEWEGFGPENRKKLVINLLEEKGYIADIKEFEDFDTAYKELSSTERYDFFISDYNLNDSKTGLTYLEKIRDTNGYKQFVILYSNNEYSVIKEDVIGVLKNKSLDVFSNFTFFSLGNGSERENFKKAIDVILCRWDELNAIRGRYMCENAELEYKLRTKLDCLENEKLTYSSLIDKFKHTKIHPNNRKNYKNLFEKWHALVKKRNMLAHVEELYDSKKGYYIKSKVNIYDEEDEEIVIFENDLDNERKSLVLLKKEITDFLNKSSY